MKILMYLKMDKNIVLIHVIGNPASDLERVKQCKYLLCFLPSCLHDRSLDFQTELHWAQNIRETTQNIVWMGAF